MGDFCCFDYENLSEQVPNVWPDDLIQMEQFFWIFWKNFIFPVCDSTLIF